MCSSDLSGHLHRTTNRDASLPLFWKMWQSFLPLSWKKWAVFYQQTSCKRRFRGEVVYILSLRGRIIVEIVPLTSLEVVDFNRSGDCSAKSGRESYNEKRIVVGS